MFMRMFDAHCAHVVIDRSKSACVNLVSACDLRRTQVSTRACDSDTLSQHAYQCVIDGWVWFLGGNGRESESGLDRD